ncbi:MAG: rRNA maturation RNase YbeY [Candidatus Shikimatogenerans bostrichidophilus]|nr:MAG: rRNA maturation RNase YbeY [Candidatus Shikimatogenerans bostrichidophilus]
MINIYMLKKIRIYKYKILKKQIKQIVKLENNKIYNINYIFCNNKYLLYINKKFLNRQYYTDTITFNYNKDYNKNILYGDIFISVNQVYNNSIIWKVNFSIEMKRVIIHSLLHLIGYNDNNSLNKKEMKNKENIYIKKLNKIIIKYDKI